MTIDHLVGDFKVVFQDAERLVNASAGALGEKAQAARERLSAALGSARENVQQLEAQAAQGARAADQAIRKHPYRSVGIAFGLGVVMGILVSR